MTDTNNQTPDLPGLGDLASQISGASSAADTSPADNAKPAESAPPAQEQKAGDADKKTDNDDLLFDNKDKQDKADDNPADDPKKDDGKKDDDPKDEPKAEAVEFDKLEIPDDMPVPDEVRDQFLEIVNDPKLTNQERTQKLVDMHIDMMHKANDAWFDAKDQWRKETMDDPDLGGQNIKKTIANANEVISAFITDDKHLEALQSDLKFLGLGNKLSFIRFLNNIHAKIGDDEIGNSFGGKTSTNLPVEKRLWPDMQ